MTSRLSSKTILVVDDEQTIREVVRRYLEREGFKVIEAVDGATALDLLQVNPPDMVVLDLMLPGVDGLTITQHLRNDERIPIIILSAKGELNDRIRGLDLGADDYVTKPFSPQELVSRVRAVFRRTSSSELVMDTPLVFGDLRLDPKSREVHLQGELIQLTATEFDLLWHLASHPRQVFSRSQLLDRVWGNEYYIDSSTVTVHIRRLREKVEIDPSRPERIVTVWGVGYKFEA